MLHLTDLMPAPDLSLTSGPDWFLPQQTLDLLARVAPTGLPVLCTACFGAAFRRVASAVHLASGRDDLVFVDLRRSAGTLPAGLAEGARAARCTLALDGIELLDASGQDVLANQLARAPFRVLSATDVPLDVLRARWRSDLLALLSTFTVDVPALARRGASIGEVARRRLTVLSEELGRATPELSTSAEAALAEHPWPGDLAELDAVLARTLLATTSPTIDGCHLRWQPPGATGGDDTIVVSRPGGDDTIVVSRPGGDDATVVSRPAGDDATVVSRPAGDDAASGDVALPREPGETPVPAPPPSSHAPAPTSDEALIATLPAPELFRTRGERQPVAAAGLSPTSAAPTLEAFAVELAHQLKNPLVTIKTFVASIGSLRDDPQDLAQFRTLTDEAVVRMEETLDGLLEFARLHAPVLEPLDVLSLLRDALRAAWRVLSIKQVTLDAPEGASLQARADREHVRFALATLARHVAETIEPRGTLRIAVEETTTLHLDYRESGAITHLRGASRPDESGLPLGLLLVRGALARVGGDVEIALDSNVVSIRLRLVPP